MCDTNEGRPTNASRLTKAAGGTGDITKHMLRSTVKNKLHEQNKAAMSTKVKQSTTNKSPIHPRKSEIDTDGVNTIMMKLEKMNNNIKICRKIAEEFKLIKEEINNLTILKTSEMFIAIKAKINNTEVIIINMYLRNVHYNVRLEAMEELLEQTLLDHNARIGLNNQIDIESTDSIPSSLQADDPRTTQPTATAKH